MKLIRTITTAIITTIKSITYKEETCPFHETCEYYTITNGICKKKWENCTAHTKTKNDE